MDRLTDICFAVELHTNHFTLKTKTGLKLYRYEFAISPQVTGRKKTRVIQKFVKSVARQYPKGLFATDFKRYFITNGELPITVTKRRNIAHTFENEDEPPANTVPANQRFSVGLLHDCAMFDVDDLIASLRDPLHISVAHRAEILMCLNIICSHAAKALSLGKQKSINTFYFVRWLPSLRAPHQTLFVFDSCKPRYLLCGTHRTNIMYPGPRPVLMQTAPSKHFKIDSTDRQWMRDLGAGFVAFRGFIASVKATTGRLLINIQIKHAAAYKSGRLTQLVDELDGNARDRRSAAYDIQALERHLKKKRVVTSHLPIKRNRTGDVVERPRMILELAHPARLIRSAVRALGRVQMKSHSATEILRRSLLRSEQCSSTSSSFGSWMSVPSIQWLIWGQQSLPNIFPWTFWKCS